MSDDRRTQPIEMRMHSELSDRELLLGISGELGAVRVTLKHLEEGGRQRDDKLDILADKVDELNGAGQKGAGVIAQLQDTVFGNAQRNEVGLVSKVAELERSHTRARGVMLGIAMGSGIGGTWLGALLKKWGYL